MGKRLENEQLIDWALFNVPANTVRVIIGDGFYRSKDPINSIKVLKEHKEYTNNTKIQ